MWPALLVIILMGQTLKAQEYFTYEDCAVVTGDGCSTRNGTAEPCIIQSTSDGFVRLCTFSEAYCIQRSSPSAVCLQPFKSPEGGQDIWPQFRNRYHPDIPTTTTTETPQLARECRAYKLLAAVTLVTSILYSVFFVLYLYYIFCTMVIFVLYNYIRGNIYVCVGGGWRDTAYIYIVFCLTLK